MPKQSKSMPIKSAAYQFNSRMPDVTNMSARLNSALVPGGKVCKTKKRGGMISNDLIPHDVKISGGALYNDGRGNIKDENEGVKPLVQAGGKKACKKGGIVDDITQARIDHLTAGKKKPAPKKAGSLFNSDENNAIDALTNAIGEGKKKGGMIRARSIDKKEYEGEKQRQASEQKRPDSKAVQAQKDMQTTRAKGKKVGGEANSSFKGVETPSYGGSVLAVTLTNPLQEPKLGGKAKAKATEKKNVMLNSISNLEKTLKELKKAVKKV